MEELEEVERTKNIISIFIGLIGFIFAGFNLFVLEDITGSVVSILFFYYVLGCCGEL